MFPPPKRCGRGKVHYPPQAAPALKLQHHGIKKEKSGRWEFIRSDFQPLEIPHWAPLANSGRGLDSSTSCSSQLPKASAAQGGGKKKKKNLCQTIWLMSSLPGVCCGLIWCLNLKGQAAKTVEQLRGREAEEGRCFSASRKVLITFFSLKIMGKTGTEILKATAAAMASCKSREKPSMFTSDDRFALREDLRHFSCWLLSCSQG